MTDIIIIGAGPAGLTAAIYALRAGMNVTLCEENIYGGQVSIINTIENYPGFKSISGADFSTQLYEQAKSLGARFIFGKAVKVEFKEDKTYVTTSDGKVHCSLSLIIANGLKRRLLGCKGEKELSGRGVSYCATCDGAFFKNKKVIIVGGGNTALEDALYLSNICSEVTMVVRKNSFRGEDFLVKTLEKTKNINVIFGANVKEIKGKNSVESATVNLNDGTSKEIFIDGVFIAIGYKPDFEIYLGLVDMDEAGYFAASESCATNIPGVYAAGDCRSKPLRQIVTAASDGAVAGAAAASYVTNKKRTSK